MGIFWGADLLGVNWLGGGGRSALSLEVKFGGHFGGSGSVGG